MISFFRYSFVYFYFLKISCLSLLATLNLKFLSYFTKIFYTSFFSVVTTSNKDQQLIMFTFFVSVPHMCSIVEHHCDHFCINTPGSYLCKCKQGYILNADQKTCSSMLSFFLFHTPKKYLTSLTLSVGLIKN